jgi:WD40 repeat protein
MWSESDWWLLALDGTPSRRTGNFGILQRQGFSLGFDRIPRLSQWDEDFITFSAGFGDSINAWRAPISRDGRITGNAQRLTSGTNLEISPTLSANGNLIFASLNRSAAVWSLQADTDSGKPKGDLKKITEGAEFTPSISADGKRLAFMAAHPRIHADGDGAGRTLTGSSHEPLVPSLEAADLRARIKDLSTGRETALSGATAAPQLHPQISRDGAMVAYTSAKPGQLYAAPVNGGSPRMILGGANKMVWDWSLNKSSLLFGSNDDDDQIHSLDLHSGTERVFLSRPGSSFFQAKFSPDDQWVAVESVQADAQAKYQSQIFVVPIEGGASAPLNRWIAIDHQSSWDDKPRWSPGGNLVYFVSDRDGHLCLWAQRLTGRTKALVGTPFPVYHFHNARLSMANLDTGILEIGVAQDKFIFGLGELTGNVWSMKRRE